MDLIYKLVNNEQAKQYELHIDELVARVEYMRVQNNIYLTHTEVPVKLEGKGIGAAIVKQVLQDIEKRNLTLVPLCPFVTLYLKRHPEWKKLVFKGINIK